MEKAVLFTRQRGEGPEGSEQQTLEAHVRFIEAYARGLDIQIIDRVVEAGISAHELYKQLVTYIQNHRDVRAIITYSTDRLARSLDDIAEIETLLIDRGIKLYSAIQGEIWAECLSGVSTAELDHTIKALVDRAYLNNLSKKIRRRLTSEAACGMWPSRAPIGYRNVSLRSRKCGIKPDKQSAKSVRRLFQKYATGNISLRQLTEWARGAGLVLNKTGRPISESTVLWILRNPIYAGMIVWNGITYRGRHRPLVRRSIWEHVQSILAPRRHGNG
jgi:site-specific DNA recombinase